MPHEIPFDEGARCIGPPLMSNARWRKVFASAVDEGSLGGVIAVQDPARVERRPPMYRLACNMFRPEGTYDAAFTCGPLLFRYLAEAHFAAAPAPGLQGGTPRAHASAEERANWLARFGGRLAAMNIPFEQRGERVVVHGYLGHRLRGVRDAESALRVIRELGARPRLIRHHELVVEAATELASTLASVLPSLRFDRDHVCAAAALHDAGKIEQASEMDRPGHRHEPAGEEMLLDAGVEPRLARAAITHARRDDGRATLEDRLVALADTLWKGKRDEALERAVVDEIARATSLDGRRAFEIADRMFERIASAGPERLGRSVVIV